MISFKTPLRYKYYFIGNFYKFTHWRFVILLVAVLIFWYFFIFGLKSPDVLFSIIFIVSLLILICFISPLLNLICARVYYKFDSIEYFFDNDSFGYKMGDYKIEIKKSQIKYIKIRPCHILIKSLKGKMRFIGEKEDIVAVKNKLLKSDYKNLIILK